MATDNTLGAPTEGLGQNITFAVNGGGGMPQATSSGPIAVRNELNAGGGFNAKEATGYPAPSSDPTMKALLSLGADILAPKIKAARDAQFVNGMQKAAAGQAITDIVDEQPWYDKLFNATNLVDGARAYTAQTRANEVAISIDTAMPELRKLTGPEFSAHINKQLQSSLTGDQGTDAMVMSQVLKQMPDKMAAQAKHHYVYQQERMTEAQRAAMQSGLTAIGIVDAKARAGGERAPGDAFMPGALNEITDEADALLTKMNAVAAFAKPEGMDDKLHSHNVATVLVTAAAAGNIAGLYAMKDAKVIDGLLPEHQASVLSAIDGAERRIRANLPAAMAQDIADYKNLSVHMADLDTIKAATIAVNEKFAKLTGSRVPYYDAMDTANELAQSERTRMQYVAAQDRERAEAIRESDKAIAHQNIITQTVGDLQGGYSPDPKLTDKDIQEAWAVAAQSNPATVNATRVLQLSRTVDKGFQDALQTNIGRYLADGNAVKLDEVYQTQYLPLVTAAGNRKEAAAAVYAGDYAKAMAAYHEVRKSDPENKASTKELALYRALSPKVDPSAVSKLDKELASAASTGLIMKTLDWAWGKTPFSGDTVLMDDASAAEYAKHLKSRAIQAPANLSTEGKLAYAVSEAKLKDGLEVGGGTFWYRVAGGGELVKGLVDGTNITQSEVNRAFRHSLDVELKAAGLTGAGTIQQLPDQNGQLRYMAAGLNDQGNLAWIQVKGEDVKNRWGAIRNAGLDAEIAKHKADLAFYAQDPGKRAAVIDTQERLNKALKLRGLPTE